MFKRFIHVGLLAWMLVSTSVLAVDSEQSRHARLLREALAQGLERSPVWLKLMHYEPAGLSGTDVESAIHSADFFLSPQGRYQPQAELSATLKAMLMPVAERADAHAVCRFPARTGWLRQQLAIPAEWIPVAGCPEFDSWSFNGTIDSISIVFATGYLGNPASYYGHTLLKLNSRLQQKQTTLLDVSVNYGAIVPDNEDPLSYIVKGVTGGYEGGFSHIQYYFHTHNYGETELRDLWEYQLDLPKPAVDLIVAHAWEVLGRKYTYYFFRKNCAYRMAELLQVVEGIDIIPELRPFTLPQSLISKLAQARYQGQPLVAARIYHPSRQSRLYQRFNALSAQEQARVRQLVAQRDQDFRLPQGLTHAEVDTLLDYYQYLQAAAGDAKVELQERYRQVLLYRYRMPPGQGTLLGQDKASPDRSRRPSRLALARLHSSTFGSGWALQLRPAYYDPLDADDAHVSNSALAMADLSLQFVDHKWRLDRLHLINIESANTRVTGLPGDGREAWMLRAGWERPDLHCGRCLLARAEGAWGRSFAPLELFDVTLMAGAAVQERRYGQAGLNATLSLRLLHHFSPQASVLLERVVRSPLLEPGRTQRQDRAVFRYALGRDLDLRFSYRADRAEEVAFGLGGYF